ncbi:hypothetical protein [Streptomyces sp. NPDC057325]|uniref:hypothetical protein n=1 Tax=unclassified Streptomyces TaxID=2593676 RepID=UPI00363F4583
MGINKEMQNKAEQLKYRAEQAKEKLQGTQDEAQQRGQSEQERLRQREEEARRRGNFEDIEDWAVSSSDGHEPRFIPCSVGGRRTALSTECSR